MRVRRTFFALGVLPFVLVGFGCHSSESHSHISSIWNHNHAQANTNLTVRFVAPPEEFGYVSDTNVSLASDNLDTNNTNNVATDENNHYFGDGAGLRVVLWGGNYNGTDVTFQPAPLGTGPYMFGLFDPECERQYQGWMSVNTAGEDVLGALEDWRASVHEQQRWLAYESRVTGQFEDRNEEAFDEFESNLQELRNLESRVANAIERERRELGRYHNLCNETLSQAEVLLVPGGETFMRPWTRPAFTDLELSTIGTGVPMTKFVLVGDYDSAMGKLDRIAALRDDLERNREVVNEEMRRLEHRRRYYMLTDHIYNHGDKFVENEKRLQEARGMVAQLDRQVDNYNRKYEAILFVTGLFAPEDALAAFDSKRDGLNRDRAVLEARINQINSQIAQVSERSDYRVRLEQKRQDAFGERQKIDERIGQIDNAQLAVREMRDMTSVIHRHGPASVVAATILDSTIPPRFAAAVEKEALMTVRLQASEAPYTLDNNGPNHTTGVTPVNWNEWKNNNNN